MCADDPACSSLPTNHKVASAREPLLLAIVGPTASGKTALSLALAERFAGEIVNCDSVAVYREFEIGTAKPSADERSRAPHHLLDIVAPDEVFTAGEYARRARTLLSDMKQRGQMPIVVGGTGLYLRALLDGLSEGPQRSEQLRARMRERVRERGPEHLHRILRRLDPAAAERIHPNDVAKIVRAVEVCLAARRPLTELWRQGREPLTGFHILRVGLDPGRDQLYERINQRARAMFDHALVQETERILARYGESARPLASLGYKQARQLLNGELDRDSAILAAQQGHRNYAKRQMTWFRREPGVHWLKGFGDDGVIQRQAIELIESEQIG